MGSAIEFKRERKSIKKPFYLKNGVFFIYAPKNLALFPTQFNRFDTEITVILRKDSRRNFK